MTRIKAGELRILVATDVAARGIDISDLSHVVSYAAPETPEVYLHRTGRTGRAGKAGVAISLVSGLDIGNFQYLQKVNKITAQERELPTEDDVFARLRERLAVKVEREVRSLSEADRAIFVDPWVPVVEALTRSEEGVRDLAAVCASYLRDHRPDTHVEEEPAEVAEERPRDDSGKRRPRRRRRRRPKGAPADSRN